MLRLHNMNSRGMFPKYHSLPRPQTYQARNICNRGKRFVVLFALVGHSESCRRITL